MVYWETWILTVSREVTFYDSDAFVFVQYLVSHGEFVSNKLMMQCFFNGAGMQHMVLTMSTHRSIAIRKGVAIGFSLTYFLLGLEIVHGYLVILVMLT